MAYEGLLIGQATYALSARRNTRSGDLCRKGFSGVQEQDERVNSCETLKKQARMKPWTWPLSAFVQPKDQRSFGNIK